MGILIGVSVAWMMGVYVIFIYNMVKMHFQEEKAKERGK